MAPATLLFPSSDSEPIYIESESDMETKPRKLPLISMLAILASTTVVALSVLIPHAPAANSVRGWTPAKASATVKAHYSTADQKAVDWAQAKLDKLLAAGTPETDPQVVALRANIAHQQHAAKVTKASCKAATRTRFRCTAIVQGSARIPPDYVLFTATKKLTLTVAGSRYRISEGWR